ncbi:hypothetical protein HLH17_16420 [Acinetobacter sp. ANC 5380]|uniref:Type IV conjugative transfer system protein TraE n=1 Tax=Acinetobacter terrae TaxID=2731247 RepID=A0A7Y2WCW9_9GAMM|nr:hypothetical protein [Acinetobacter terrae]
MRFSLFNGNWELSHKVAIVATGTSMILAVTVLVQSYGLANKRERIVITPPTIDQAYQVQWDSANTEYYQSFAVIISGVIGHTNNQNIENSIKTLNQFLSPSLQRQMAESLRALVLNLPKQNFTSWFTPKEVSYERKTGKIFVSGFLNSSLTGSQIQSQPVVYEYVIKMQSGKPVVTHFDSYAGSKPKTLSTIRKDQAIEAEAKANQ